LSPKAPGYFKLKLKVYDKDEEEKFDEETLKIDVIALSPKFSSLQALPQEGGDLTTPVNVNMKLYGAVDPDGQITQYKWWYYDVDDPDEILGMQITQSPNAIVTIGTKGSEGQEKTYGFGVEVTDNDNTKVNSEDELEKSAIPTLKVKNGPNAAPTAKFNVDRTKIFAGESVNFSSASSDPDGKIVVYIWDFEGDGFFNNEPTALSTISHTYDEKNLNGIQAKLKVVDDKSGEAISQPVTIFVDSNAKIPKAAFKAEVVSGKTVKFTSNSEADKAVGAEIKSYRWDFDTVSQFASADTDGNGKKDDDNDSDQKDPEFTYDEYGIYQVKLTVKDTQGNENSVTNTVSVSAATAPQSGTGSLEPAASSSPGSTPGSFGMTPQGQTGLNTEPGAQQGAAVSNLKASIITSPLPDADGVVRLTGTSGSVTFDFTKSEGSIAYYIFDKNINFDTNKNGIPNDEEDFKTSLPGKWTTNFDKSWGKIVVKLTVKDIQGNVNSTVQEIAFK
jgi:PKD repeat protein